MNASVESQFPASVGNDANANGDYVGSAAIPLDPGLSPLGWFGGQVMTMHPLIGSSAIDADIAGGPGGTDARGFPRHVDGDGNESPVADIGAVEAGPMYQVTTTADSGPGSLRTVLASAMSGGSPGTRLGFSATAFPGVITLGGSELAISPTPGLFIDASDIDGGVTISGDNRSRVFSIHAAAIVAMHSLKMTAGKAADGAEGTPSTAGQPGLDGGGVHSGGSLSLFSCEVSGNRAGNGGIAVYEGGGMGNGGVGGKGGSGGGIFSLGPLVLSGCSVSGNSAGRGGSGTIDSGGFGGDGDGGNGGGICSGGHLHVADSTMSGNNSGYSGGTVSGYGGSGGGIYKLDSGRLHLTHCTIADNRAGDGGLLSGSGGGVVVDRLTLGNCVIAGNSNPDHGADDLRFFGSRSLHCTGANLFGSAPSILSITGPAPIIADPLLAPLGDYGGPTRTMALRPGSSARNAGTASSRTMDQRGYPVAGQPDIGAYEAGTPANYNTYIWETLPATATTEQHASTADYDGDGAVNGAEFIAGTHVMDPGSVFRIKHSTRNGTVSSMTFPTVASRTYQIQTSTDLKDPWIDLGSVDGTGADVTIPVSISLPRCFFRIRVSAE